MSALRFVEQPHSLSDRVFHALERQSRLIGRRVRYEIIDQNVILTGTVQTYFQKQMAQEMLRGIDGIESIVNDLEVVSR